MKNIYLIKAESPYGDVSYKIGITIREPSKRLKELQTGNPNKLELIYVFKSKYGSILETSLHNYYKSNSLEGEWFSLEESQVNEFLNICNKTENNLKILHEHNSYFQSKNKK